MQGFCGRESRFELVDKQSVEMCECTKRRGGGGRQRCGLHHVETAGEAGLSERHITKHFLQRFCDDLYCVIYVAALPL